MDISYKLTSEIEYSEDEIKSFYDKFQFYKIRWIEQLKEAGVDEEMTVKIAIESFEQFEFNDELTEQQVLFIKQNSNPNF